MLEGTVKEVSILYQESAGLSKLGHCVDIDNFSTWLFNSWRDIIVELQSKYRSFLHEHYTLYILLYVLYYYPADIFVRIYIFNIAFGIFSLCEPLFLDWSNFVYVCLRVVCRDIELVNRFAFAGEYISKATFLTRATNRVVIGIFQPWWDLCNEWHDFDQSTLHVKHVENCFDTWRYFLYKYHVQYVPCLKLFGGYGRRKSKRSKKMSWYMET